MAVIESLHESSHEEARKHSPWRFPLTRITRRNAGIPNCMHVHDLRTRIAAAGSLYLVCLSLSGQTTLDLSHQARNGVSSVAGKTGAVWLAAADLADFKPALSGGSLYVQPGSIRFAGNTCGNFVSLMSATPTGSSGGSGLGTLYITSQCQMVLEYPSSLSLVATSNGITLVPVEIPSMPPTCFPVADITIVAGAFASLTDRRAAEGSGSGTMDHAALQHLDYSSSGHTGFQAALGFTPENSAGKDTNGGYVGRAADGSANVPGGISTGTGPALIIGLHGASSDCGAVAANNNCLFFNTAVGDHLTRLDSFGTLHDLEVATGGSSGYAAIEQSGNALPQRNTLNFNGSGVSCSDNSSASRTDCTVSAGGGSSPPITGGGFWPWQPGFSSGNMNIQTNTTINGLGIWSFQIYAPGMVLKHINWFNVRGSACDTCGVVFTIKPEARTSDVCTTNVGTGTTVTSGGTKGMSFVSGSGVSAGSCTLLPGTYYLVTTTDAQDLVWPYRALGPEAMTAATLNSIYNGAAMASAGSTGSGASLAIPADITGLTFSAISGNPTVPQSVYFDGN